MTIKPKDELRIFVYSANGEAAAQFNVTEPTPLDMKTLQANSGIGSRHYYLVDNEGNIDYPLIGKLNIQGMTIEQAASFIKEKIRSYFTSDADYGVKVYITNYYVSVMGEVRNPNSFTIESTKVNVLEALARAGDLTIYGTRTNVKLLRQRPDGEYDIHQLDLRLRTAKLARPPASGSVVPASPSPSAPSSTWSSSKPVRLRFSKSNGASTDCRA